MYKLRFLAQAEQDLISIAEFIARESGSIETATKFTEKLISKCELLAKTPGMIGNTRPELRD